MVRVECGRKRLVKRMRCVVPLVHHVHPVLRTTERTTNLAVILLGAGLSALLVYSLTTELFSKNSPTVLYNDACERIKASSKVKLSVICCVSK